jgi:hypothetical protein
MEKSIKKWLAKFKSEPNQNMENVYIPRVAKTVYPDVKLSFNEQAQHIYKSVKEMKYDNNN